MADGINMQLEGSEDLLRELRELGIKLPKVLRGATLAGARIIQADANESAPSPRVVKQLRMKGKETCEATIGPDFDHWFHLFLEYGTVAHEISPKAASVLALEIGSETGFSAGHAVSGIAARPFLRPALDRNAEAVTNKAGDVIYEFIEAGRIPAGGDE